jgi:hypothetical protein
MNDRPTPASPPAMPWRVLVLDASPGDPKWLLCTVTMPSDIRPAVMEGSRYADWPEVTEWVRSQAGGRVSLVPIGATAWRVDEGNPR